LRWPPQANNNLIAQNKLSGNAGNPPPPGSVLPNVDLLYGQLEPDSGGNCFEKNKPKGGLTFFSTDGELPTDGC
jgi:hypothetical protein